DQYLLLVAADIERQDPDRRDGCRANGDQGPEVRLSAGADEDARRRAFLSACRMAPQEVRGHSQERCRRVALHGNNLRRVGSRVGQIGGLRGVRTIGTTAGTNAGRTASIAWPLALSF